MSNNQIEPNSAKSLDVDVLPPESSSYPTNKSELDSRFKELGRQDGKEIVAAAGKLLVIPIPGLGKVIDIALGTGEYSDNNRLQEKQFKWMLEEIYNISCKINCLMNQLSDDEKPEPADVAAIMEAAMKVSRKTAGSNKRKLLKNALVNSFDLEQYQKGLMLRLFSILENVEYGDVELLRKIYEKNI